MVFATRIAELINLIWIGKAKGKLRIGILKTVAIPEILKGAYAFTTFGMSQHSKLL